MTASPPVRINPRMRERLIAVRREAGRRRLRILLVVSSVVSAVGLVFLALTSPFLDVDHVRVSGAVHETAAEVRAAARVHLHDHLLFVDLGAAARRLEELPWVARARVRRDLPGTVAITITEYAPSVFVREGAGVLLVAANGHVIARAPSAPPGLVEVRGVRRAPAPGTVLAPAAAAGVVEQLPAVLARAVVAVDVGGGALALDLAGGGQLRLGDASNLALKAAAAQAVLAHLAGTRFSYVDVSDPWHPVSRA